MDVRILGSEFLRGAKFPQGRFGIARLKQRHAKIVMRLSRLRIRLHSLLQQLHPGARVAVLGAGGRCQQDTNEKSLRHPAPYLVGPISFWNWPRRSFTCARSGALGASFTNSANSAAAPA